MEEAEGAQDSAPSYRPRPRRTAAERRAQAQRAQGRVVQSLLRGFQELGSHRGCRPTRLGAALAAALGHGEAFAPPPERPLPTQSSETQSGQPAEEASIQTENLNVVEPPWDIQAEAPTTVEEPEAAPAHSGTEELEEPEDHTDVSPPVPAALAVSEHAYVTTSTDFDNAFETLMHTLEARAPLSFRQQNFFRGDREGSAVLTAVGETTTTNASVQSLLTQDFMFEVGQEDLPWQTVTNSRSRSGSATQSDMATEPTMNERRGRSLVSWHRRAAWRPPTPPVTPQRRQLRRHDAVS